jgi:hypothetical protein
MRRIAVSLLLLLTFLVVGCGKPGKTPAPEQMAKVTMGMSIADVEAILGRGIDITTSGPQNTSQQASFPVSTSNNVVVKQWGQGDTVLFLRFVNGGLSGSRATGLPGPGGSSAPSLEEFQNQLKSRQAEAERSAQMAKVYALLIRISMDSGEQLPERLDDVAGDILTQYKDAAGFIRQGTIIVRWGRKLRDPLLAYEANAASKGGYVITYWDYKDVNVDEFARLKGLSP